MEKKEKKKMSLTFIFSSLALTGLFAASASPIPLYSTYTKQIGLTTQLISLTAVFYFVGCVFSLTVLSRLANHIGRKPVALIAVVLGLIGLLFLLNTDTPVMIIIARLFQGLSCGLASSVLSLLIVESGASKNRGLVTSISGSAVFSGLAIGGLLSGIIVQINSHSAFIVYWLLIAVLIISFFGIFLGTETMKEKSKGALKSLYPNIYIPAKAKKFAIPSALIFISSWSMGGYFQAYSSTIGTKIFNFDSPLLAAIFLVCYMAPNPLGIQISQQLDRITSQRLGVILYTFSVGLMLLSFSIHSLTLCILSIIGSGITQSIGYSSAMQNLLENSTPTEKAGVLSFIYLLSYGGAGVPSFISGKVSLFIGFGKITAAYFTFILVLSVLTLLVLQKLQKN